MSIEFKKSASNQPDGFTDQDREENRAFLRKGVEGVRIRFVGAFADALLAGLPGTESVLMTMNCRCCPDEHIGTVELYENGAINAYLRQNGVPFVAGIFRYR